MTKTVSPVFAAVDLGASGGRVIAGILGDDRVELHTVYRFPNAAREQDGHLRWNLTALYANVLKGLAALASEFPDVVSIGIDTWGVDYGLLDDAGELLAQPVAYRDGRTAEVVDRVHRTMPPDELYRINGLQVLPFNTIYQLVAEQRARHWDKVARVALLPDLLAFWLTGELRTEATNASTTGLVDVHTGAWSPEILGRFSIRAGLFAPIEQPGCVRGHLRPGLCEHLGLRSSTVVTTVGSHDTASAVAGVPASSRRFAYVSSGTWSLVGVELDAPILTNAARVANFTNERGIDGRVRFLRNVGGLWLLQELLAAWNRRGTAHDVAALLAEAAEVADTGARIDPNSPDLVGPGDMEARVAAAIAAGGHGPLDTPAAYVRCIIESLAEAYARNVRSATALAGLDVDVVHIVGGGSQNELLCRRTADHMGLPVVAGPVEATALGNVLVQARSHGVLTGSIDVLRAQCAESTDLRRYEPDDATVVR
jgi:rhamnulokinase